MTLRDIAKKKFMEDQEKLHFSFVFKSYWSHKNKVDFLEIDDDT